MVSLDFDLNSFPAISLYLGHCEGDMQRMAHLPPV